VVSVERLEASAESGDEDGNEIEDGSGEPQAPA
jgi:hypothetical protein